MKSIELTEKQKSKVYLAAGSSHLELAQQTADEMGIPLGDDVRKVFPSGERFFRYSKSIRGLHVFAMQSLANSEQGSVNDSLMELMTMVDAAKRGSAHEITVVMPYMAYGRQDRKAKGREPITAATVINMLQGAGADRLVSVDMHSPQTQAVFDGPFDHLTAEGLIRKSLKKRIDGNHEEFVIVSPDGGRAKVAEHYAAALNLDVMNIPKTRSRLDSSIITRPDHVDGVDGRTAILIDDMIDTAGTLVSAADTLRDSGATGVIAAATHGLFSDPALERLQASGITELAIVDTVPLDGAREALGERLTVISSARMLAISLGAIATGKSVSEQFHGENYL
jgi:ribose-phosphate pyrophosphokinase